jgi:hypothetical protein
VVLGPPPDALTFLFLFLIVFQRSLSASAPMIVSTSVR